MGRESLGEVLGRGAKGGDSHTYDPGEAVLNEELVKEILESHFRGTLHEIKPRLANDIRWEAEHLESLLDSIDKESQAQLLVDSLVTGLELNGEQYPSLLLSPLVQALYNKGHNNLKIDLAQFQDGSYRLAHGLKGKEGELLRLTISCPQVLDMGERLEHCHLTFSGHSFSLGYLCKNSILEQSGRTGHVGRYAKDCSITTDSVYQADGLGLAAESSQIYISKMSQQDLHPFLHPEFFTKGNTLYVLDESGEWRET